MQCCPGERGYGLRPTGPDRWRACCPAHGGSNPSALSVGSGAYDAVLLKCWHGCDAHEVVQSLVMELSALFPPRPQAGAGPMRRRGLLTAMQTLDVKADRRLPGHCARAVGACVVLQLHPRPQLDDAVVGQPKIIGGAAGIAGHQGEQAPAPGCHARRIRPV